MRPWTRRSFLAAGLGLGLFLAALLVSSLDAANRTPMLRYGFPAAAVAFHAGLGLALVAALHKEKGAAAALAASGAPVVVFWVFLYLLVEALGNLA